MFRIETLLFLLLYKKLLRFHWKILEKPLFPLENDKIIPYLQWKFCTHSDFIILVYSGKHIIACQKSAI